MKDPRNMTEAEINNIEFIGLDDSFMTGCRSCGKCCKDRDDIMLTAYDVFKLARFLERTPGEIIERYCVVRTTYDSLIMTVWIKPIPPDSACPFLRNKRCSVHKEKPSPCRLFPLARSYGQTGSARFFAMERYCTPDKKPVKVREWIGELASEENDKIGRLWTDALYCLVYALHPSKCNLVGQEKQSVIDAILTMLYLPYDTKEPFLSQFEQNVDVLRALLLEKYSLRVPSTLEFLDFAIKELGE